MTKDPNERQVDSGVTKKQTALPDRTGRLAGHTNQPMKGEAVKAPQEPHPKDPKKPQKI